MTLTFVLSFFLYQEEATREVPVRNEHVQVKTILIEDRSSKCKVALWRDLTKTEIRTGDYVRITDVITNIYKNETSLSTTSRTKITVCI